MTALPDEDEFSELIDAQFNRVDLVRAGANGVPFLIAKQDGQAGLLEPDFVRDLIAKAEPEPSQEDRVTMTGSPAAIAKLIHEAALKAPAEVAKAKNDTADRKKKAATGAAMSDGSYPIASEADLDKAIHAVGRGGASHDAIRKHIIARARSLGASSKIPGNWNSDGSLKGDSVSKTAVAKDAGDMLDAQLDDGVDGMDPTVPLAAPDDDDAPGDPTDPGSPAWEAIDAATAQKWCSILSRARVAIDLLSEREMLEAASADPGDMDNACDLQDVCCAIDYAISVLAPFAVAEQSEADCGAEDLMAAIGKAVLSIGENQLGVIEGLVPVAKAGRVLSSANEALIRTAGESLQKVLASLPSAPVADDVAKQKETAVAAAQTDTEPAPEAEVAKAEDAPPAQGGVVPGKGGDSVPASLAPGDSVVPAQVARGLQVVVYDRTGAMCHADPARISQQIAKADASDGDGDGGKAKMVAVFDAKGDLVGVCDPADITPVAGADAPSGNEDKPDDSAKPAEAAPDASDMTPAPPADAGTPADGVAKAGDTQTSNDEPDAHEVLKSIVTEAVSEALGTDPAKEDIRKQAEVIAKQSEEIEALKARLTTVEGHPAAPKVFTNGAVPPPGTLRGQDRAPDGAPQVDVAKARELKDTLYHGSPAEQNKAFTEMQEAAIAGLAAIHGSRR